MQTEFNNWMTLEEVIRDLKELNCKEITRVLPGEEITVIEWN